MLNVFVPRYVSGCADGLRFLYEMPVLYFTLINVKHMLKKACLINTLFKQTSTELCLSVCGKLHFNKSWSILFIYTNEVERLICSRY